MQLSKLSVRSNDLETSGLFAAEGHWLPFFTLPGSAGRLGRAHLRFSASWSLPVVSAREKTALMRRRDFGRSHLPVSSRLSPNSVLCAPQVLFQQPHRRRNKNSSRVQESLPGNK